MGPLKLPLKTDVLILFKFSIKTNLKDDYEKKFIVDDDKSELVLSTANSGFLVKLVLQQLVSELLNDDEFDVMITDVGLPDGDTLDVLPKIQT